MLSALQNVVPQSSSACLYLLSLSSRLDTFICRANEASSRQQHCSSTQLLTLPNIIQEAPALLDCLPPDSRTALSSCNRQLRAYCRSVTKIILLDQGDDVPALTTSDWPMLAMVVLRKAEQVQSTYLLCGDQFDHLATLMLADSEQRPHVEVYLVRRYGQNAAQQLSTALLHLHQPQYAALHELSFEYCGPIDVQSAAYMATAGWEQLKKLRLSSIELDASAARCLADASWPRLTSLMFMECGLDQAAMAGLVQGQWPELKELDLSINPLLGGAALSTLASANWPNLKSVELECVPLSSGSFDWLSVREWTRLSRLDLMGTGLNAPLVSELARTHISHLNILELGGNQLGSDAVAALVTASMPFLPTLFLCENQLDAAAAQWLPSGAWPRLESLDLSDNCLDNEAMQYLAQGQWLYLKSLSLIDNEFDSVGVESLTHGEWTNLSCLELDTSLGNAATWRVLDLDPQFLPDLCARFGEKIRVLVPRLEQGSEMLWQALQDICFYKCSTSRLCN